MPKTPKQNSDPSDHKLTALVESLKADNITQFGEIKKEFGGVNKQLEDHGRRIGHLEKDKIARDAIEAYKKSNGNAGQPAYNAGGKNDASGVIINKELLTALKYLGLVVAALAAAILAMKATP